MDKTKHLKFDMYSRWTVSNVSKKHKLILKGRGRGLVTHFLKICDPSYLWNG